MKPAYSWSPAEIMAAGREIWFELTHPGSLLFGPKNSRQLVDPLTSCDSVPNLESCQHVGNEGDVGAAMFPNRHPHHCFISFFSFPCRKKNSHQSQTHWYPQQFGETVLTSDKFNSSSINLLFWFAGSEHSIINAPYEADEDLSLIPSLVQNSCLLWWDQSKDVKPKQSAERL